jgi:hypothetical protein
MKTTHTIDGQLVEIKWEFMEVMEKHDSNWCDWMIIGEGSDGKTYGANCGADGWHPEDSHDSPENIEEIDT